MIDIQDNYLPETGWKIIYDNFSGLQVPWNYQPTINDRAGEKDHENNWQFVHEMFSAQKIHNPAPQLANLMPLLNAMPIYYLLRVKMNLNPRCSENWISDFHTDTRGLYNLTSIYYLNTCNGGTIFKDGTKVDNVANRLVTFPATMEHAGMKATDVKARFVLNINWFPTDEYKPTEAGTT